MTHWEGGIFVNKQWFALIQQLFDKCTTYIHMDNVRQEMDFDSRGMQEGSEGGGVREEWKEGVAMVYFTVISELASLKKLYRVRNSASNTNVALPCGDEVLRRSTLNIIIS